MYMLAEGFRKKGWDVSYVAGTWNSHKDGCEEEIGGIKVYWYKRRKFFGFRDVFKLFRILEKTDADIFYNRGRSFLTGVVAYFAQQNNKKFVWSSNGRDGCERNKHVKRLINSKKNLFKKIFLLPEAFVNDRIYEYGIKVADLIVNQTRDQKNALAQIFKKSGVIIKTGYPIPEKLCVKLQPPIVLWLANLYSNGIKRPELFIQLAMRCKDLKCKFVMAGTASPRWVRVVNKASRELDNFEYIGGLSFEESNRIISEASIVVNTSLWEGISNVMIQAWLHAVPVVTLFYDPDDVIKKHGLGFHSQNFEQLIKDVRYLVENPQECERIGRHAREFASREYNVDKIVDNLTTHILKLFKNNSSEKLVIT
jgi:glycosyltransferase involved in cell wall biosynthesis